MFPRFYVREILPKTWRIYDELDCKFVGIKYKSYRGARKEADRLEGVARSRNGYGSTRTPGHAITYDYVDTLLRCARIRR